MSKIYVNRQQTVIHKPPILLEIYYLLIFSRLERFSNYNDNIFIRTHKWLFKAQDICFLN